MDAERELIRRDSIPGLETLLSDDAFSRFLTAMVPHLNLDHVTSDYLRYKPGTSCLVSYSLSVDGVASRVYAKAHAPASAAKLAKFEARVNDPARPRFVSASDRLIGVAFFPHDLELRSLRELFDKRRRAAAVAALLPELDAQAFDIRAVRYKPERRFVGSLSNGGSKFVVRLYDKASFAAASEASRIVSSFQTVTVPRMVGNDPSRRMIVLKWLEGQEASERWQNGSPPSEDAAAIGVALARLHDEKPALRSSRIRRSMGGESGGAAQMLSLILPEAGRTLRHVSERLSTHESDGDPVLLHGDFYASQILVREGGVAMIDFDEMSWGDRWVDVSNFLAHLELDVALELLAPEQAATAADVFVAAYEQASRHKSPHHLRQQVGLALQSLAIEPFRFRRSDWPSETLRIVERVADLLSLKSPRATAAETRSESLALDACDPRRATQELNGLPRFAGQTVTSARVVRQKTGRRMIIEYSLTKNDGSSLRVLGKIRSKGLDRRAFALQRLLWLESSDRSATHRIRVAEPLGCIESWNMWLQEFLDGEVAAVALAHDPIDLGRRAAEAIAWLHGTRIDPARIHTVDDELTILQKGLHSVSSELPELRPTLDGLLSSCTTLLRQLKNRPVVVSHRDFYADQLILGRDFTALVDLDLCTLSDPALDVGNFIAHLRELALRTHGDIHALDHAVYAFEERYKELRGDDPLAVRAWELSSLVRLIVISRRIDSRRHLTESLAAICATAVTGALA